MNFHHIDRLGRDVLREIERAKELMRTALEVLERSKANVVTR
jgi:hypothetical protein